MGRKAGPRPLSADRCVALSHHSASLGPFPHKLTEGDRTSQPFQLPPALTSWTCCHKREVGLQTTHQTPHILNRGPPPVGSQGRAWRRNETHREQVEGTCLLTAPGDEGKRPRV